MRGKSLALLAAVGLGVTTATHAGLGDLFKSAGDLLQGTEGMPSPAVHGKALSESQITQGLKEALSVGAERAVALLGRQGGFLDDAQVRIPLPGMLQTAGDGLRAVGQGDLVDEFELTVNRAAEQAIPRTLDIVQRTVSDMSLEDVRGILNGGDDAATRFLQEHAGEDLHRAILPIVAQATDRAGATTAYKRLQAQLSGGLGGWMNTRSLDLDQYVTGKTLDGLFLKLAQEEKAIRQDPIARTSDLLKTVFGPR